MAEDDKQAGKPTPQEVEEIKRRIEDKGNVFLNAPSHVKPDDSKKSK
ncbi:hypothetical protein ORV05_05070 [Amycolatopsis cynarae]|uniref:Uncharacterized protein n=1 Tax=Amycolatopsis cynarae TaxID=2995223 RepID=A0ABY7B6V7_9PSEU|nr:hypothetical protein [Amycolatopsis sp. HUAS 11-8]WAL67164.1 hypothetical protein ORV05_05070 [Amycolatopsis sp. HUAS 11-8]